jgi:lysyl-tRNA synthetase, class I
MSTRRFNFKTLTSDKDWAEQLTDFVVREFPQHELYTCAAGISPSGPVHFGNFRDIVTSRAVVESLKKRGKSARLVFSWDNFDRFRKVPAGVPASFARYVGRPLSKIPDPLGDSHLSYAERFQAPFVEAMRILGVDIEYRDQTTLHEAGTYDEAIFEALSKRHQIADILLRFMTAKAKEEKGIDPKTYREEYYPIAVYSRFTGKDSTKIVHYDGGSKVTYVCLETGTKDTVDLSQERIAKLAWKPDWAMRWRHEGVVFEPGGHDHASPGGSFDVSSVITKDVFGYEPPAFAEYKFVGIQGLGAKMSGSKGNAITPRELLDIYEPDLLNWMYRRKSPDQSFQLAFDTEIYRQYDEYDRVHQNNAIPFRQIVGFGQIVQWQEDKLHNILLSNDTAYEAGSITRRLPLARAWLTKYNPEEMITLLDEPNAAYWETMDDAQKARIHRLKDALTTLDDASIPELESLVYAIPKEADVAESELKKVQRAFFKDVYNMLIGNDTGPRLGTFLWAVERQKVRALLSVT